MGHLGDFLLTWISEVLPPASLAPTTLFPHLLRLRRGLPELRRLEIPPLSVGYTGRGSYATKFPSLTPRYRVSLHNGLSRQWIEVLDDPSDGTYDIQPFSETSSTENLSSLQSNLLLSAEASLARAM